MGSRRKHLRHATDDDLANDIKNDTGGVYQDHTVTPKLTIRKPLMKTMSPLLTSLSTRSSLGNTPVGVHGHEKKLQIVVQRDRQIVSSKVPKGEAVYDIFSGFWNPIPLGVFVFCVAWPSGFVCSSGCLDLFDTFRGPAGVYY